MTWIIAISLASASLIALVAYLWGRRKADFSAGYTSAQVEVLQVAEEERKTYAKKAAKIDRLCSTHRQRLLRWWMREKNPGKVSLPK